jgi:hypothetical protein
MFLVAPRALIKLFVLHHLGKFKATWRLRFRAFPLDGCLYGLVDEIADR